MGEFTTDFEKRNGHFYHNGKPVRNGNIVESMIKERVNINPFGFYELCQIFAIPDGDFVFVIPSDGIYYFGACHCGVPNEVHGTCCGWYNAKTVIDELGNIRDDRHPFYNRQFNDWINERWAG